VIISARQVDVYAYGAPCDMRKQYDTLAALVKKELGRDPLCGNLYLFVSRNRKRAKILYFDGTGLCLFAKRLEKGRFAPVYDRTRSREVKLTLTELTQFIEGSELIARSPALLTWADLTPRWPDEENRRKSSRPLNPSHQHASNRHATAKSGKGHRKATPGRAAAGGREPEAGPEESGADPGTASAEG